jgi:hypothetical protein
LIYGLIQNNLQPRLSRRRAIRLPRVRNQNRLIPRDSSVEQYQRESDRRGTMVKRRCPMSDRKVDKTMAWCIVVADDHGPEYVPSLGTAKKAPVQFCNFGEPTTLLQRALLRAQQMAPARAVWNLA